MLETVTENVFGKKMLSLKPLAQQQVSTSDSKLGFLADTAAGAGLTTTYAAMIQAAFAPKYWNNTTEKVVFDANGIPSFQPGPAATAISEEFLNPKSRICDSIMACTESAG